MAPDHLHLEPAEGRAAPVSVEAHRVAVHLDPVGAVVGLVALAVGDVPALHVGEERLHPGVVVAEDGEAVERDPVHEVEEPAPERLRRLPVIEVLRVDVRDDGDGRRDAQERAVGLVRLDDHVVALPELRVRPEGVHLPADHRGGIEAGVGEEVRRHRGGGGLPVRAGDGDAVLEPHELGEHLGPGDDRDLAPPRLHHLGVVAPDRRGDDDDVHLGEVLGGVAPGDATAERGEAPGDVGLLEVGAGDGVAEVEEHLGDAAHADAADPDEVDLGGPGTEEAHVISL